MSADIELLDCEGYEDNDACFRDKCSTAYHDDEEKYIDLFSYDELGKDDERVIRTKDDDMNAHCYNEKGFRKWVEDGNETEPKTRVPFRKPYPENLGFQGAFSLKVADSPEARRSLSRAVAYNDIDAFRLYLSAYNHSEEILVNLFMDLAAMTRGPNREALFREMINDERIISVVDTEEAVIRLTGALERAAESGNTSVVDMLLQDGRADPSHAFNYSIVISATNGFTEIVQMLLEDERVDAGVTDNLALTRAVIKSSRDPSAYEEIVKSLLRHPSVKVSFQQMRSLIEKATSSGSENIRQVLLQQMPLRQRFFRRFFN